MAPSAQGLKLGADPVSVGPPDYIIEGTVLHALLSAETALSLAQEHAINFGYIEVQTGNWKTIQRISSWCNSGNLGFVSAAATSIVQVMCRLAQRLPCPLLLKALPGDFFENNEKHVDPLAAVTLLSFTELQLFGYSR